MISRCCVTLQSRCREIVPSPTWWRQSPDPERTPVLRRMKEEKGQAQPHLYSIEHFSVKVATFRLYALYTAIEQRKRRFKKEDSRMRTHISRSSTTSTAIPDRTVLRRQLEDTRSAFHAVVESLTDANWYQKTNSTAWTVGEVLTHFADALAGTPEAIEH